MTASTNRRHFRIAGLVLAVETDASVPELRFHAKFKAFETDGPGPDTVLIRHHGRAFPDDPSAHGRLVAAQPPYEIFDAGGDWVFRIGGSEDGPIQTAVFSKDYRRADIYTPEPIARPEAGLESLTLLPTDQILLAPLLAARGGCLLHAGGVIDREAGLLFAGHSTAGKSTMMRLLRGRAEILCDDRIALRPDGDGFRIYGTWSHGDVPDVSPESARLGAFFLLRKSEHNAVEPIPDRRAFVRHLLELVIKPLPTAGWWAQTLEVVERLAASVRAYELFFDLSGRILGLLDAWQDAESGIDIGGGNR
jgi:hypothetical protein